MRFSLVLALLLLFSACSWKRAGPPSYLIIAVEELGFDAFACQDTGRTDSVSGLQMLCAESLRFTHAYTPSVLSQSALASLLTARYPQDHGVWDNGANFISAQIETAAEVALRKGYRTAFVSGGAPVWRKSGVNQGFEIFEDNFVPKPKTLYRPVAKNLELLREWIDGEAGSNPFFAVVSVPDLLFVDAATVNDLGEIRESSFSSQFAELDETSGHFFEFLKKSKRWDNTHIIFVGLNGHVPFEHEVEPVPVNLRSERTHVNLLVKPARKMREGPFTWKVDMNVSLVDLGATLYSLLGEKIPSSSNARLQAVSLDQVLEGKQSHIDTDRLLLSESSWALWRGLGSRRWSLRSGPYLFIYDGTTKLYNTLTDSLETSSLAAGDARYSTYYAPFERYIESMAYRPWSAIDIALIEKISLGRVLWRTGAPRKEALERLGVLGRRFPTDPQLLGWRAIWALRLELWDELKIVAAAAAEPLWSYVAARNLLEKDPKTPAATCFAFFARMAARQSAAAGASPPPSVRDCDAPEFIDLYTWLEDGKPSAERTKSLEKFYKFFLSHALVERSAEANWMSGLSWDISLTKPGGPGLVDLILALPEFRRHRQSLSRRVSAEND